MNNLIEKLPRLGVLVTGYTFVAGIFLFAFAYFTVSIPDPNAYVNSQSTIIQYADGSEYKFQQHKLETHRTHFAFQLIPLDS